MLEEQGSSPGLGREGQLNIAKIGAATDALVRNTEHEGEVFVHTGESAAAPSEFILL